MIWQEDWDGDGTGGEVTDDTLLRVDSRHERQIVILYPFSSQVFHNTNDVDQGRLSYLDWSGCLLNYQDCTEKGGSDCKTQRETCLGSILKDERTINVRQLNTILLYNNTFEVIVWGGGSSLWEAALQGKVKSFPLAICPSSPGASCQSSATYLRAGGTTGISFDLPKKNTLPSFSLSNIVDDMVIEGVQLTNEELQNLKNQYGITADNDKKATYPPGALQKFLDEWNFQLQLRRGTFGGDVHDPHDPGTSNSILDRLGLFQSYPFGLDALWHRFEDFLRRKAYYWTNEQIFGNLAPGLVVGQDRNAEAVAQDRYWRALANARYPLGYAIFTQADGAEAVELQALKDANIIPSDFSNFSLPIPNAPTIDIPGAPEAVVIIVNFALNLLFWAELDIVLGPLLGAFLFAYMAFASIFNAFHKPNERNIEGAINFFSFLLLCKLLNPVLAPLEQAAKSAAKKVVVMTARQVGESGKAAWEWTVNTTSENIAWVREQLGKIGRQLAEDENLPEVEAEAVAYEEILKEAGEGNFSGRVSQALEYLGQHPMERYIENK